jgi:hypothetical protein
MYENNRPVYWWKAGVAQVIRYTDIAEMEPRRDVAWNESLNMYLFFSKSSLNWEYVIFAM